MYKAYKDFLVIKALYSKSDKVLLKLIQCFNMGEKAFRIRGQFLKFTPTHVSILLGLPNKGTQLKLHTKDELKASYGNQYFAGLRQL